MTSQRDMTVTEIILRTLTHPLGSLQDAGIWRVATVTKHPLEGRLWRSLGVETRLSVGGETHPTMCDHLQGEW